MVKMEIGKKDLYNLYSIELKDGICVDVVSTSLDGAIKKLNRYTGKKYGRRDVYSANVIIDGII